MSWKQPFVVHPDGLIPYSTIFHDWVLELSKRKRLGGTMLAVFMLLCEHVEFGNETDGKILAFASYSRERMSKELHISETAVRRATDRLKDAGLIEVYRCGHKGSPTVYTIMPGRNVVEQTIARHR